MASPYNRLPLLAWLLAVPWLLATPAAAASLSFTITTTEPVLVTGAPRIAIDVGGVSRYATYSAGSGTTALTFGYAVQPGDFDMNGITLVSPLELNGGSIKDVAGNPLSPLAFTLPDTSNLKVQTYTAAFAGAITNDTATAAAITIDKAPAGGTYSYTITSSGGSGSVNGAGSLSGTGTTTISNINVANLPAGTLTLSVTVSKINAGTGTARTATATPGYSGILEVTPIASAFSIRRLRSAYTGPIMRVRRSSDNAEQNIGYTVDGTLDASALAVFCGAASCFVRTWYDQSGLGRNMSQTTAASQPLIFAAGAVQKEGARPALRFTSSAGQYLEGNASFTQLITSSVMAVARCADTTIDRHVFGDRDTGVAAGRILRAQAGGGSYLGANIGGSAVTLSGTTAQQRTIALLSSSSRMTGALDGAVTAGSASSYFQNSSKQFRIGSGGAGQDSGDWVGTVSEVLLFNFTLSGERPVFERNQGAYFGISVP